MLTKKYYDAIADILSVPLRTQSETLREPFRICVEGIAAMLADYFERDNANFQRARFLRACGIELCPKYNEPVLPDEKGMCSLCGEHEA